MNKNNRKNLKPLPNFTIQKIRRNLLHSIRAIKVKFTKGENLKVIIILFLSSLLFFSCKNSTDIYSGGEAFPGPIQAGVEGLPDSVKAVFHLDGKNLSSLENLKERLPENLKKKLSKKEWEASPLGFLFLEDSPLSEWKEIVVGISPSSSMNGSSSGNSKTKEDFDLFVFFELSHKEKEIIHFFEDLWGELEIENLQGFTSFTAPEKNFRIALLKGKFLLLSNQLDSVLEVVRKEKPNVQTHKEFPLYQEELETKNPLLWGIVLVKTENENLELPNQLEFLQQYQNSISSFLFSIQHKESDSLFEMELDTLIYHPEKIQEFVFLYQLGLGFLASYLQENNPELESVLKRTQVEKKSDRVHLSFFLKENEILTGLESELISK